MKTSKITLLMEKFWLVVAILTTCYALYLFFSGHEVRTIEYVFPIITFVLFFTRRSMRKRIEAVGNYEEKE